MLGGVKRARESGRGSAAADIRSAKSSRRAVLPTLPADTSGQCWVCVSKLAPGTDAAAVCAMCRKAGIVRLDATGAPMVRMQPPDAALLCFLHPASVSLAQTLLDDVEPIEEPQESPEANITSSNSSGTATSAMSSAKAAARQRVIAAEQRAALSWAEEGDESVGERVVVLRNVFDPADVAADDARGGSLGDELMQDVADEAVRFGVVSSLVLHSKHGAITIAYESAGAATEALAAFNGRFFGGRKIVAGFYDGVEFEPPPPAAGAAAASSTTDADEARQQQRHPGGRGDDDEDARLDEFGKWLEEQQDE